MSNISDFIPVNDWDWTEDEHWEYHRNFAAIWEAAEVFKQYPVVVMDIGDDEYVYCRRVDVVMVYHGWQWYNDGKDGSYIDFPCGCQFQLSNREPHAWFPCNSWQETRKHMTTTQEK